MFRNPRENAKLTPDESVLPSTGRPPTPPLLGNVKPLARPSNTTTNESTRAAMSSPSTLPVLGRDHPRSTKSTKKKLPQSQSILSFFGKAQPKAGVSNDKRDAGLFFDDASSQNYVSPQKKEQTTSVNEVTRYNEESTPSKRMRLSQDDGEYSIRTPSPTRDIEDDIAKQVNNEIDALFDPEPLPRKSSKQRGGFVDDSDDEDDIGVAFDGLRGEEQEMDGKPDFEDTAEEMPTTTMVPLKPPDDGESRPQLLKRLSSCAAIDPLVPSLDREGTSMYHPGDFDQMGDFENEEFAEGGEEYEMRRWMEEQRDMEMGLDEDSKSEGGYSSVQTPTNDFEDDDVEAAVESACPICGGSMASLSEADASVHVNACLDGNAKPLPKIKAEEETALEEPAKLTASATKSLPGNSSAKRFMRAAVAKPAQANPFALISRGKKGVSAFSKLMSGHAEDAAWAEAATNEAQSRGKQAYQRTCPFYKIMPGLNICVDAFRYGKVEGQNAYFLSHFHSDHYIGLTSSWCHGPIYASKVTCNLMREQLRVDPKWVVPLEFEKKTEVPGTNGVFVTMIPANHCPGSSLYMFEKVTGKNKDGSPRLNRMLHCGDFRACPAHVQHPLLRPDVMDAVTGQTKQQVIDTCYLDTTYLTPKYSFPSQHDVIDACAQMCVSLAKEIVDVGDAWEKVKLERAGSTMKKFLEAGEENIVKKEEPIEDVKPRFRGRLLVVIGTYSIGKERICLGIARALKSKIYAPPAKRRICACLEDAELNGLLTSNPLDAQVHMQTLMEIRAETLHDYMAGFNGQFARVVGFRPTGWTYRPPTSRFTENPAVNTVLTSEGWKTRFTMRDLVPQRGSTKESNCFGVPYSEHSSFRELTMFCCALNITRIIPTVNVGSARSREKMKAWIEKWDVEKRKNGLFQVEVGAEGWGSGDGQLRYNSV